MAKEVWPTREQNEESVAQASRLLKNATHQAQLQERSNRGGSDARG